MPAVAALLLAIGPLAPSNFAAQVSAGSGPAA